MSKPELRAAARKARKSFVSSLSPDERRNLEKRLASALRPLVERARAVGGYHAVGSEIDVAPVLKLAKRYGLPAFDDELSAFKFRHGPASVAGPHGIPQPGADAEILDCSLILVPLLAIDPNGHRLGQGGGHYDRALPALRAAGATLIGVGWQMQRLNFDLPDEPWDIALDGFASPAGLEMFR
jgi:5-formyltetrahydrofolate cyclo-ligase